MTLKELCKFIEDKLKKIGSLEQASVSEYLRPAYFIEAEITLDEIKKLIKNNKKNKSPLTMENIKPFLLFLDRRWSRIVNTDFEYTLNPEDPLNVFCLQLAEELGKQINQICPNADPEMPAPRFSLLMPTVKHTKNDITRTYFDDPDLQLNQIMIVEDRFIDVDCSLDSALDDAIPKHTSFSVNEEIQQNAIDPSMKLKPLNDREKRMVIHHSVEAFEYYENIKEKCDAIKEGSTFGAVMTRFVNNLRKGGEHGNRGGEEKNAGKKANEALPVFKEFLDQLILEDKGEYDNPIYYVDHLPNEAELQNTIYHRAYMISHHPPGLFYVEKEGEKCYAKCLDDNISVFEEILKYKEVNIADPSGCYRSCGLYMISESEGNLKDNWNRFKDSYVITESSLYYVDHNGKPVLQKNAQNENLTVEKINKLRENFSGHQPTKEPRCIAKYMTSAQLEVVQSAIGSIPVNILNKSALALFWKEVSCYAGHTHLFKQIAPDREDSFGDLWIRLSIDKPINLDDIAYCIELIAGLIEHILKFNHYLNDKNPINVQSVHTTSINLLERQIEESKKLLEQKRREGAYKVTFVVGQEGYQQLKLKLYSDENISYLLKCIDKMISSRQYTDVLIQLNESNQNKLLKKIYIDRIMRSDCLRLLQQLKGKNYDQFLNRINLSSLYEYDDDYDAGDFKQFLEFFRSDTQRTILNDYGSTLLSLIIIDAEDLHTVLRGLHKTNRRLLLHLLGENWLRDSILESDQLVDILSTLNESDQVYLINILLPRIKNMISHIDGVISVLSVLKGRTPQVFLDILDIRNLQFMFEKGQQLSAILSVLDVKSPTHFIASMHPPAGWLAQLIKDPNDLNALFNSFNSKSGLAYLKSEITLDVLKACFEQNTLTSYLNSLKSYKRLPFLLNIQKINLFIDLVGSLDNGIDNLLPLIPLQDKDKFIFELMPLTKSKVDLIKALNAISKQDDKEKFFMALRDHLGTDTFAKLLLSHANHQLKMTEQGVLADFGFLSVSCLQLIKRDLQLVKRSNKQLIFSGSLYLLPLKLVNSVQSIINHSGHSHPSNKQFFSKWPLLWRRTTQHVDDKPDSPPIKRNTWIRSKNK